MPTVGGCFTWQPELELPCPSCTPLPAFPAWPLWSVTTEVGNAGDAPLRSLALWRRSGSQRVGGAPPCPFPANNCAGRFLAAGFRSGAECLVWRLLAGTSCHRPGSCHPRLPCVPTLLLARHERSTRCVSPGTVYLHVGSPERVDRGTALDAEGDAGRRRCAPGQ